MANSKIIINFLDTIPEIDMEISFTENYSGITFYEKFKQTRTGYQVSGIPVWEPPDQFGPGKYLGHISTELWQALREDYNSSGNFIITRTYGPVNSGFGSVTVEANYPGAIFTLNNNTTEASVTIFNEEVIIPPVVNSVTPESIVFDLNNETINPDSKNIEIITADNWSIATPLPNWLQILQLNGNGNSTSVLTPINYHLLPEGQYIYNLLYNLGSETFEVRVILNVAEILKNPFVSGNLYFTKENIALGFNSTNLNSFVHIKIQIKTFKINSNISTIYNREYKFPLFKGKGDFYVGDIVQGLLDDISDLKDYVPDFKSNYIKKQFRPTEVTITYDEKNYMTEALITSGSLGMFKMIKGHRPYMTSNQLCLLTVSQQEITRITPNSIIGTSFVYIGKPRILVRLNNKVLEEIEIAESANQIIYSYYRFINDLKPGDSIEITIVKGLETRTQRFLVFKNGKESSFIFFENSNGLIEPYEFTGRRRIPSAIKHTTTVKLKNRVKYEKKVFSENQQSLIINTGQLIKTDHRIISAIIGSENVWCSLDNPEGRYFEIDATTTKLTTQDTDTSEEDFDIEFNILEDANASIYPH